ncbi:hypothetical protein [Anaerobacillus alkalilacustris]|uniref:hypothetical protein n=1 Tax=Anaerobacillus alkalilacustris TaxID=393763 RepID=UPI001FE18FDB|nr:hypothetical protein [Anaerobacillus alkalilacustris]
MNDLKRLLVIILVIVILLIGIIGIKFGSALGQEGNPTPVLTAIMKLESSNSHYEQVTDTEQGIKFVSKNGSGSQEKIIKEFMVEKGFEFKEQMGSGYIFEKDEMTTIVVTRLFTKNYFLWEVPNEVNN